MVTYFTSDLHLFHSYVARIRGYMTEPLFGDEQESSIPDLNAHNQAVAAAWSVVKPDDIVWVLGDICVSHSSWKPALEFIETFLPGRKRLICGNHDPASSVHRDAWKYRNAAHRVFETVQDFAKIRFNGKTVLLSHYPYTGTGSEGLRGPDGEEGEERYTEFRLTDCGTPLLHGHTHGQEKLHFSDAGTPEVHVGLDAWNMKLVHEREVAKLLDSVHDSAKVES